VLIGVVGVVTLLLAAVVAVAVALLIVWIRWQRQGAEENAIERVQLKSSPTHLKEEEREEEVREHENTFTATNAVYSTVDKSRSSPRPPSPAHSFTSETEVNHYSNADELGNPVRLKPIRHAPPVPAKKQEHKENQEITTRAAEEDGKSKPRRPPPPKPTHWGVEEPPTPSSFTPQPQAVQPAPAAKPVPPIKPTKPKEDHQPLQQQQQQHQPSPAKKRPVPPEKPQSRGPPVPPSKPVSTSAPATKPKPLVLPKPMGIGDGPSTASHSTPEVAPKPKVKPRVPSKPTNVGGDGEEEGASVPVPVAKFGEHVASLHSDGNTGFSQQFDSLPMGEYGRPIFDGVRPEHACRNRYNTILPYNDNRPKLQPLQGHMEYQHNYINASFIDGLSSPRKYIAAQGPLSQTVIDFWRMVWQEKVPTIVMLTSLQEGPNRKCQRYWPEFGTAVYGPYQVTLKEQQVLANYILSTLEVTGGGNSVGLKPRTLQHMQFTAWQDNDSPDQASSLLSYLRRLRSLHNPSVGPLLVHCSAGVGRTGSFLAIDLALEQAKTKGYVDIPAIIFSLRRQRMKMVQTQYQYRFIHDAVLEQLVCGDTQIQSQDFRRALQKLQQQELVNGAFKSGFAVQFDVLEQVSPKPEDVLCRTAMLYLDKNRTTNYLPPDESRVPLKGTPSYIHASFAHGYRQKHAFIISQAPMEETCRDFWKMVHERECGVIVMLSGLVEEGRVVCQHYWPTTDVDMYGEYAVTPLDGQTHDGFLERNFSVTDSKTRQTRYVSQLEVLDWNSAGKTSSPAGIVDCMVHADNEQRRNGDTPIVVHCSDSVTRSGIFCAAMAAMEHCRSEGVVDIYQAVRALRQQRPGAVPRVEHYKLLHELLLIFLQSNYSTYTYSHC
jgi:protein tyrosine phosphatase